MVDIDFTACKKGHTCQQGCIGQAFDAENYLCSCDDGFVLGLDGSSCNARGKQVVSSRTCEQLQWKQQHGRPAVKVLRHQLPCGEDLGLLACEEDGGRLLASTVF